MFCVPYNEAISGRSLENEEEWCLEHGLEYICMQNPANTSEELEKESGPFVEKFGGDRVKEILETTMWPKMNLKSDEPKLKLMHPLPDNQKGVLSKETISIKETFNKDADNSKTSPNTSNKSNGNQNPNEKKVSNLNFLLEDMNKLFGLEEELDQEAEDSELKNFEKALQEITQLRNQGKNLPDEQRRELAAKIALSFFGEDFEEQD